jgi:hypothetical protein
MSSPRLDFRFASGLRRVPSKFLIPLSLIIALGAAALPFDGCMTPKTSVRVRAEPGFTGGNLQRLAVFPIVNSRLVLSDEQQLYGELLQAIVRKNSSIAIISSADAMRTLHQNGLGPVWTRFLATRDAHGLPDSAAVRTVGRALDVDAILQGEIVQFEKTDGLYGHNRGNTHATLRYFLVAVDSGSLLWEASSDGLLTTFTPLEAAPPLIEVVRLAHQRILETLPF